ncbi:SRPBCC family protein [Hufsiella ginkgonis]|uniref:SRPBCC domain-containing protein n=1 Tax=Hufsiella ginkgonis TaxID=2695274 RepID=A0A7K1XWJ8_9SPHI|nr:SRPBCC domain-containing protein [Hufsiella ginkgonis]MXV15355.1 SRPBCC domain-containing protein [Hufsiella ginkgonis]
METKPLVVERIYNAPVLKVWRAITDKDQMKQWYFELEEFKAEKGFKFTFTGGDDKEQYLHECEVIAADPPHKLSYSWTYPKHNNGYSVVNWDLSEEGEKTRLRLTHEGLESFPKDHPSFAVSSFTQGWNAILGESLKKFVEEEKAG